MILLFSLLAGLWSQAPDTTRAPLVPKVDSTVATKPVLPPADTLKAAVRDTARSRDSVGMAKDTTRAPLPPPPPAGPLAVPVMDAGPVVTEPPAGPVGSAGPVNPLPPTGPVGPAGPAGPGTGVVVPPPTFGPSGPTGTSSSPTDSAVLRRSTASAMGLSLLLPGLGHRWIGRSSRAPIYHALDLLGFTAVVVSWQMKSRSLESATEIANRHAGSSLGDDPDPDLLSAMRNYRSRRPQAGRHDSYDEAMLLSGKSTTWQFPDDAAHDWDWGSRENADNDANLRSFESQLRMWRTSQVALYSAAGTLVVLRLVSALDVLRLNRSSAARAGIALDTKPIPGGMESKMAVNF